MAGVAAPEALAVAPVLGAATASPHKNNPIAWVEAGLDRHNGKLVREMSSLSAAVGIDKLLQWAKETLVPVAIAGYETAIDAGQITVDVIKEGAGGIKQLWNDARELETNLKARVEEVETNLRQGTKEWAKETLSNAWGYWADANIGYIILDQSFDILVPGKVYTRATDARAVSIKLLGYNASALIEGGESVYLAYLPDTGEIALVGSRNLGIASSPGLSVGVGVKLHYTDKKTYSAKDLEGRSLYVGGDVSIEGFLGAGVKSSFGGKSKSVEYNISTGVSLFPVKVKGGVSTSEVRHIFVIDEDINKVIKLILGFDEPYRWER